MSARLRTNSFAVLPSLRLFQVPIDASRKRERPRFDERKLKQKEKERKKSAKTHGAHPIVHEEEETANIVDRDFEFLYLHTTYYITNAQSYGNP